MISREDCWLGTNCKHLHCSDPNGCMILYKLDYLYNEANVPLKLRAFRTLWIDDDGSDKQAFMQLKEIQDNICSFVEKGNQLYLHSKQAGNGKTSWELRLLQSYFNKIWLKSPLTCRALFINVPYFLLALKENISTKNDYVQHIKENVLDCDLVIWDDIGTKTATTYESEHLLSMIDGRINAGKANIFSSNLNDTELHDALGDRLSSRICNLGYNIELVGGDKRGVLGE